MKFTEIVLATIMRRDGGSGVQSHVALVEEYLRSQGRPVSVVNPFTKPSLLMKPLFATRFALQPLNSEAAVWWYRHWHGRYLSSALLQHLGGGGARRVIYAQCPVSAAAALRVRTNEPVVMAVHFNVSQAEEWATDKGLIRLGGPVYQSIRRLEEQLLPRLDGIVYVSDFMRGVLERRIPGLALVPSEVIPNFVKAQPATSANWASDIITVGALEPRKNQSYLLDILAAAAAQGYRYRLTVVGDGPERVNLERRVRLLGLSQQVRFTGHHPNAQRLMTDHRVYCHTSRMENLPIALLEAMGSGLPVLAAPVGGIPEIVRSGIEGFLWNLSDPMDAARQLITVLETPSLRERMGMQARRRAREEFSDLAVGRRLERFLVESSVRGAQSPGSRSTGRRQVP